MTAVLSDLAMPFSRVRIAEHADYRPDVDGLRAVAVLGVLVYHAWPTWMPGGFAGVDVFFVISGFLISGIVFRGLERGTFSSLDFYARRIRRIFPALIAMLLVVWVIAWPLLLWDEYRLLGKHIVAGAGFALNLVLYSDFNLYFGVTTTPLIHLWSLGVEEQFYIVWPLFLLALWKWGSTRNRLGGIVVIAILSFAANIAALTDNPTSSFYLPASRMWELALGSALAYLAAHPIHLANPKRVRLAAFLWGKPDLRSAIGALLLVVSFAGLRSTFAFPGWWALAPCIGAWLLISAGPQSWLNRRVLSSSPVVFIGLISYPLYLWHWPLISLAHIYAGNESRPDLIWAAVGAALVLAILTFKLVEVPVRTSHRRRREVRTLCAGMTACAVLGLATFTGGVRARSEAYELDRFIVASREDWFSPQRTEWTWFTDVLSVGSGRSRTLFVGDSNMQQYYPRIAKMAAGDSAAGRGALFAARAGCAPAVVELLQTSSHFIRGCKQFLREALARADGEDVDTVVIAALWHLYVTDNLQPAGQLHPGANDAVARLGEVVRELVARGKRVYLVLTIPVSPYLDPRRMIRRTLAEGFSTEVRSPTRAEVENARGAIVSKLRQMAVSAGATVIDPVESLCNSTECPAVAANGEPMYHDAAHLRPSYVRDHVRFLDATLLDPRSVAVSAR